MIGDRKLVKAFVKRTTSKSKVPYHVGDVSTLELLAYFLRSEGTRNERSPDSPIRASRNEHHSPSDPLSVEREKDST
jgi:hypothetical protein